MGKLFFYYCFWGVFNLSKLNFFFIQEKPREITTSTPPNTQWKKKKEKKNKRKEGRDLELKFLNRNAYAHPNMLI